MVTRALLLGWWLLAGDAMAQSMGLVSSTRDGIQLQTVRPLPVGAIVSFQYMKRLDPEAPDGSLHCCIRLRASQFRRVGPLHYALRGNVPQADPLFLGAAVVAPASLKVAQADERTLLAGRMTIKTCVSSEGFHVKASGVRQELYYGLDYGVEPTC